MEKIIHRAKERGFADHGWLKSAHSFSFAGFYNPDKTQFGLLRVLNDDHVEGGMGFGRHPHNNMEIVSIPLSGALKHEDSTGRQAVIHTNDVQIMSAGRGISHSEYNASKEEPVKFLQIWVFPKEINIEPRYEQKTFDPAQRQNKFQVVVSPDDPEAIWINQNAYFSLADVEQGKEVTYEVKKAGNSLYLFVLEGSVVAEQETLKRRDALGLSDTTALSVRGAEAASILMIEVPAR
jgi:redox-sensitive bicupin YhaK (pirin superfamily)